MTDTIDTPAVAQLADLPARARVHELAKQFGISSRLLLDELTARGVAVRSASSGVDAADAGSALLALADRGELQLAPPADTPPAQAPPTEPAAPATGADVPVGSDATAASTDSAEPAETTVAADSAAPGLPARLRVSQLAKLLGRSTAETVQLLVDRGVAAKAGSSMVGRKVAQSLLADTPVGAALPAPAAEATEQTSDQAESDGGAPSGETDTDQAAERRSRRRRGRGRRGRASDSDADVDNDADTDDAADAADTAEAEPAVGERPIFQEPSDDEVAAATSDTAGSPRGGRRRRRRGGRGDNVGVDEVATDAERGSVAGASEPADSTLDGSADAAGSVGTDDAAGSDDEGGSNNSRRRRRRRRGTSADESGRSDDPADTVVHVREVRTAESQVQGVRGSTRLEAKRQRRRDSLQTRRRPQILTEAEFLARRESVHRVMAVRQRGELSQVALLEDGVLVEHFVSRAGAASMIGNIYLGRVQNVLPSMEAAFVDIGRGRNAVLYAGEVDWDAAGLSGKSRKIETALSSGDSVLVQVSKDPVGHKGARLTTQISLPGRFLVYVPAGGSTGISRKLPDTERKRLKTILDRIVPADAGVIVRTAAEGIAEAELVGDVERLTAQWQQISEVFAANAGKSSSPRQLYSEPDTLIKVIRDLFNSDIDELVVDGDEVWAAVSDYVTQVAPELGERLHHYDGPTDVFAAHRIDEQIAKALERKVFLPSGGSLVIDRTEAMTVVDVNTGKYTGAGGNLEETVTKNNLEAAEEVVRQLRLRDIGGIIVVDFIDMVLESNRELVLRRLTECLGRDRTRHQVAEVTSLGLVQMTRKKMGTGLLEAFSEQCDACHGRGVLLRDVPIEHAHEEQQERPAERSDRSGRRRRVREPEPEVVAIAQVSVPRRDPRGPRPPIHGADAAEQQFEETGAVPTDLADDLRPVEPAGGVPDGVLDDAVSELDLPAAAEPVVDLADELMAELNDLAVGSFSEPLDDAPVAELQELLPVPDDLAEAAPAAEAEPAGSGARRRGGRRRSASRPAGPPAAAVDPAGAG